MNTPSNTTPSLSGKDIYRHAFEHAGSAMFIADAGTGIILDCNAQAEALIGRRRDQIIGMHQSELHPEGEEEKYKKKFALHLQQAHIADIDGEVQRSDGRRIPIMISAQVMEVDGKKLILGIFTDLTPLKCIEEELGGLKQRIEFILGATKTGLDIIDSEFNIRYIDPEWQTVYGDPAGKKCYEYFMGAKQVCASCGIPKALATRKPVVTEEILVKENNRPIQVTTIPFQNEKGEWLVAEVNVDIAERKRIEEELKKHQQHLEELVDNRTRELTTLNEQLQKDIAERKRIEEAQRDSEERFRAIFESTRDCILVWDKDYNYLYANQAAIDHVGTTRDKVIGKNMRNGLGHIPDFMQRWMERVDQVFASGKPMDVEDEVMVGDRLVCSESTLSPIRDSTGNVFAVGVVYRDVTGRVWTEEALRVSETKYRIVADNTNAWEFWMDPDGRLIYSSPSCEKITGYSSKEFEAAPGILRTIIHPDDLAIFESHEQQTDRGTIVAEIEFRIIHRNGSVRWISHVCQQIYDADGKYLGTRGSNRDITGHKLAEEALKESEERYRSLFEQAPDSVILFDAETGDFVAFNDKAHENLGYARDEFQRLRIPDLEMIESPEEVSAHIQKVVNEGGDVFETKQITKRGEIRDILVSARLISVYGKTLVQGIWRDITVQKQVASALQESEEKYRALVDGAGEAIVLADTEGNLLEANKKALELLGYSKSALTKMHFSQIHPEQDRDRAAASFKDIVEKGGCFLSDVLILRKDGTTFPVDIMGSAIEYASRKVIQGIFRDISERKRIEQMKDNLIRDVSHELKAPIAMMEMAFAMGQKALGAENIDDAQKAWSIGFRNLKTLSKDVNNILGIFSLSARRVVPQRKQISLKRMVAEIVRDLRDLTAQKKLRVKIDIPREIDKIYADRRMMRTLVYNIIDNAIKFTRHGTISLIVRSRGNEICLKVKDTGRGIAEKDMGVLFTRFFKHDPSMQGTGLGLAICKDIAGIYGGTIQVTSAGAGKGTTVIVKLPRAALGI